MLSPRLSAPPLQVRLLANIVVLARVRENVNSRTSLRPGDSGATATVLLCPLPHRFAFSAASFLARVRERSDRERLGLRTPRSSSQQRCLVLPGVVGAVDAQVFGINLAPALDDRPPISRVHILCG